MASRDRIAGFDGLRAIAFLLVFASHKFPIEHRDPYGDMGVWIFFVLSGFLITRILAAAREEVEAGKLPPGRALGRFYFRRTARIFPIYYTVLGIGVAVSMFVPIQDFWKAAKLAHFFYVTNIYVAMGNGAGDFGHLWSLAVEEQFYLLFAPFVLMTPRSRTWMVCLGFIAVALVTKLAMEAAGAQERYIDVNSLVNFGLLGLGGVVGLAARRPAQSGLTSGGAQALTALCLLALPVVFGRWAETWLTYGKATGLIAALLVFQIAQGQKTWFVGLLHSPPLRLLGRISYGTYLIHPLIHFQVLQGLLGPLGVGWAAPQPVQILAEFVITVILATISWIILERPILEWAARVSRRAPVTQAQETAPAPAP